MTQDPDTLVREWIELAPAWIREMREGRNAARAGLLDPAVLAACGDVEGLDVLDCGCGEGRFSRMLTARGARRVLGVDLCGPMVEAAHALRSGRDEYRVADGQDLREIGDGTFDLAVSYLNQCDLPDIDANNREIHRVLRTGGRFVVANVHPMRAATGLWKRQEDGTKDHVILDRYFDEGERHFGMLGVRVTNFHRTLETYVRSFLRCGFLLEDLAEPTPDRDQLALYPELDDELRVPNFILFVLRKGRASCGSRS